MAFIKRQISALTNDSFLFVLVALLSIVFLFGTGFCYQDWSSIESNRDLMPLVFFLESLPMIIGYSGICIVAWVFMLRNIYVKKITWVNLAVSISVGFITIFTYYLKLIY